MTLAETRPDSDAAPLAAGSEAAAPPAGARRRRYLVVILGAWVLAILAARIGVPAPALLAAIALGVVLRLSGAREVDVPKDVSKWTQAFIGVMLGGYLHTDAIRAVGPALIPFLLVSVVTIFLSLAFAWVLSRWSPSLDRRTATLGLMAGGSSAVVTMCADFGARKDTVGFMQYTRVLLVSLTAPFVVIGVADTAEVEAVEHALWIVGRGDQVAGLSTAIVLAVVGMWLGKRFGIPGGGLIGPMLVAAVIGGTALSRGFAPQGPFKELLMVVVGLEVGLMFDARVIRALARSVPLIVGAIGAMCGVVAALAFGVGALTGVPFADAYLATTPGGINAVVASASSSAESNMALIATTQSLRLIVVVLALPLVVAVVSRSGVSGPVLTKTREALRARRDALRRRRGTTPPSSTRRRPVRRPG